MLNRKLLNSIFKFKPQSRLRRFIASKEGGCYDTTLFKLATILTVLKDIIRGEGLYDEKNPYIILCSAELELALDMKALHVSEIRDLVLKHLIKIDIETFLVRCSINEGRLTPIAEITTPTTAQQPMHVNQTSTIPIINKEDKFICKPKFLLVLHTMPEVDKNRTTFTYGETTLFLSNYILRNKEKFFDLRNIKVAIVKDDLLGDAFGVNAFHRCQVDKLLIEQLIPFDSNKWAKQNPSPNHAAIEAGTTVPTAQNTNDATNDRNGAIGPQCSASSLTSNNQMLSLKPSSPAIITTNKRSNPEYREEGINPKFAKVEDYSNEETLNRCGTEKNNIPSAQHSNPNEINIESIIRDDESMDEEIEYHRIEYEPDTCSENERTPQTGGEQINGAPISSSGSDSDINENFINTDKNKEKEENKVLKDESCYWGDTSEDEEIPSELNKAIPETLEHKNLNSPQAANDQKCIECKKPSKSPFKVCSSCWSTQNEWRTNHSRKRKRGNNKTKKETYETITSPKANPQNTQRAATHLCLLCCTRAKDAGLVHGKLTHQISCYSCAKKLWKKRCPICRRKVEKIVKIIQA